MTDENRPSSGSQSGRRRPPTIDLRATEVPPEATEAPADAPSDVPRPDLSATEPPSTSEEPFIPPPPVSSNASESTEAPDREQAEPSGRRGFAGSENWSWSYASAAVAGAAGGALMMLLLWLAGAFSSGVAPRTDSAPRLAAIEAQLRELGSRPVPVSADPKAIEDIAARLGRLESAQAQPRGPVTDPAILGRVEAAERAVKALTDDLAATSRRADAIEAALSRRLEGLEASLRESQGRLGTFAAAMADLQNTVRAAAAGSNRAVRLAVSAAALREAVERGSTFAAELAIAKPLASDASALAPLEPFASSGVPNATTLAQELTTLLQPMLRATGEPPREGGFLERLQANAEKLVRIRPIDEGGGDTTDRQASLARIEQRAARADIPGALAEIAKLPPEARAPLTAWTAKAEARNRAIDTSRRFASNAVEALKAAP